MSKEPKYTTSVEDRLRDLFHLDETLDNLTSFRYEWRQGYEVVEIEHEGGGSLHYSGVYHPEVICETGTENSWGVCIYCGATLFDQT